MNDWHTLPKIPGFVLKLSSETTVHAVISLALSTGDACTNHFMCPPPSNKTSSELRSGERKGQVKNPSDPNYIRGYVTCRKCRVSAVMYLGIYDKLFQI